MLSVLKKIFSGIGKVLGFRFSIPLLVLLIVLSLAALATIDFARKRPEVFGLIKGPSIIQQEEEELVRKVGELIELPMDEKPSVATVTEPEKLGNQPFFVKAKSGDKVLIFTNAKKVVLYRPSENRIVEVGAVNIGQEAATEEEVLESSPTPEPTQTPAPVPTEEATGE